MKALCGSSMVIVSFRLFVKFDTVVETGAI